MIRTAFVTDLIILFTLKPGSTEIRKFVEKSMSQVIEEHKVRPEDQVLEEVVMSETHTSEAQTDEGRFVID